MTSLSTLESLQARVRAAKGADRELDLALAQELVPDVLVSRQEKDELFGRPYTYWSYTGDIVAAMAFVARVLPDADWVVSRSSGAALRIGKPTEDKWPARFESEIKDRPAASLIDAALSALISQKADASERKTT